MKYIRKQWGVSEVWLTNKIHYTAIFLLFFSFLVTVHMHSNKIRILKILIIIMTDYIKNLKKKKKVVGYIWINLLIMVFSIQNSRLAVIWNYWHSLSLKFPRLPVKTLEKLIIFFYYIKLLYIVLIQNIQL